MKIQGITSTVENDVTDLTYTPLPLESANVVGRGIVSINENGELVIGSAGAYNIAIYGMFNELTTEGFNRAFLRVETADGIGFDAGLASFDNNPDNSGTAYAEMRYWLEAGTVLKVFAVAEALEGETARLNARAFLHVDRIAKRLVDIRTIAPTPAI